jgi:hypothetical protein
LATYASRQWIITGCAALVGINKNLNSEKHINWPKVRILKYENEKNNVQIDI